MEDTPGFTLVVAGAALGMALFVNQRRENRRVKPPSQGMHDGFGVQWYVDPIPR